MNTIPPELIQSYACISNCLLEDCSDSLFLGIADGGNHYLEHGIKEGTRLVFDRAKSFQKGQLENAFLTYSSASSSSTVS